MEFPQMSGPKNEFGNKKMCFDGQRENDNAVRPERIGGGAGETDFQRGMRHLPGVTPAGWSYSSDMVIFEVETSKRGSEFRH